MTKDEIIKLEIVERAMELFQQFGMKKTTMDEIAAACGKAKSTLYHYFKNKEEVFEEVIVFELQTFRRTIKPMVEAKTAINDKMLCYFVEFNRGIYNRINVYRTLSQEFIKDAKKMMLVNKIIGYEQSFITRILEDAYDAGEFTDIDKTHLPEFAEILIAAFFGIVRYSVETEKEIDIERIEKSAKILLPKIFS